MESRRLVLPGTSCNVIVMPPKNGITMIFPTLRFVVVTEAVATYVVNKLLQYAAIVRNC
jgi:hypothetical protein